MIYYKTLNKIGISYLLKYPNNINFIKVYALQMLNKNLYLDFYRSKYLIHKIKSNNKLINIKQELDYSFKLMHNKIKIEKINQLQINQYYINLLSIYLLIDYYNKELIFINKNNINFIINNILIKLNKFNFNINNIYINININNEFCTFKNYIDYIIFELLKNSINAIIIKDKSHKFLPIIFLNIYQVDNNIIIHIFDNGIGIQDLNKIYDFTYSTNKLDNLQLCGYGLGLSFINFIIEFLGGKISIDSLYGYYTSVKIYLPNKYN